MIKVNFKFSYLKVFYLLIWLFFIILTLILFTDNIHSIKDLNFNDSNDVKFCYLLY